MTRIFLTIFLVAGMFVTSPLHADSTVDTWRHADPATVDFTLRLARRAFDSWVLHHQVIDVPSDVPPLLKLRSGIFISTSRQGAPRTCMGTLYPLHGTIAEEIIANALISAGRDHRFPPVKPAELKHLRLIVSIVGRPQQIDASQLSSIDPLHDGLAVRFDHNFGVVLNGETRDVQTMGKWGRIRAGANADDAVDFYRLDVVRFIEPDK
ncbi:MAG: AMMECR1 domain-containing protein [Abditibacteriaceae bacterium]